MVYNIIMKNKKKHLQVVFQKNQFPLSIVHTKIPEFNSAYIEHYHAMELELQFFKRGDGYYFIKNRRFPIKPASVMIIHRYDVHHYIKSEEKPFIDKICVILSPNLFEETQTRRYISFITRCSKNFNHHLLFREDDFSKMELLLDWAKDEMKKKNYLWKESVILCMEQIILMLLRGLKEKKQRIETDQTNRFVVMAFSYIEQNFTSQISLRHISETLSISPFYFSHLFKQYAGISFKTYLIKRRIEEAKKLLRETNLKLIAVAHKSGFSDANSFTKIFKKFTGLSPSAYRKIFHAPDKKTLE